MVERERMPAPTSSEAGYSLIELMVAMAVISIVMSSLATFFTTTISVTNAQSNSQTAIQLVNDALERVRALKGSAVTTGRDQTRTAAQWATASSVVNPYLTTMVQAYDSTATTSSTAALPTTAQTVTINSVPFSQNWYVGRCWQPVLGGDCTATQTSGAVAFYRVVAAVGWTGRRCPATGCVQLASTLVSSASSEPVFNSNQTAAVPQVINPGRQDGELTVPVDLTVTAATGAPPLTWAATGLPTGLTMTSGGRITGTPTAAGTYSVLVTVTDGFNLVGSAAFTWIITTLPALTNPGPQSSQGGVAIASLTPAMTGGVSPLSWAATGLPTGLSIDSATGTVTGTPTAAGSYPVTVTVTDTYGKSASTAFTWTVPPLAVATPAAASGEVGVAVTALQISASGGVKPYAWSTTNLPAGLSISTAGLITGAPTTAGSFATRVTVTDAAGTAVSTAAFTWTVIPGPSITAPVSGSSSALGSALSGSASATGGSGGYSWGWTNMPTGASLSSAGAFTGSLTATGRYLTTITVTDSAGGTASVVLDVKVTSGTALRITSPSGSYARADTRGQAITPFTAVYAGGTGTKTWTATGLPTGITINSSTGAVSGTPSVAGTYTSRLTVTDGGGATSNFMFSWTIA